MPRTPSELLLDLRSAGLFISLRGDRIAILPREKLTAAAIAEIRRHRSEIVSLLRQEAERGPTAANAEASLAASPLERLEASALDIVRRRLTGPPCRCSSCSAADLLERLRMEDRWRFY